MKRRLPRRSVCQNCGTPTPGSFCPACGQDSREHTASLRDLIANFWGDVFTFDTRLTRSIGPLFLHPGLLTVEYLRGRRVRYIPPLRLFVFVSLAFFFLLSFKVNLRLGSDETSAPADSAAAATLGVAGDSVKAAADDSLASDRRFIVMGEDVSASLDEVIRGTLTLAPKAVFLLLPVFAGLLALIYRRSRRMFIEHLIFTLHYHAVLFLGFTLGMLIDWEPLWVVLLLSFPLYLLLAMHRVYGQGWGKTLVKLLLLTGAYNFVLINLLALTAGASVWLMTVARQHPWLLGWLLG